MDSTKNSPDVNSTRGEHGAESKDESKGKHFLAHFDLIALLLFIAVVVASQFWFQAILQTFRDLFHVSEPTWWQLIIISIVFTLIIYYLSVKIFRVPIASLF